MTFWMIDLIYFNEIWKHFICQGSIYNSEIPLKCILTKNTRFNPFPYSWLRRSCMSSFKCVVYNCLHWSNLTLLQSVYLLYIPYLMFRPYIQYAPMCSFIGCKVLLIWTVVAELVLESGCTTHRHWANHTRLYNNILYVPTMLVSPLMLPLWHYLSTHMVTFFFFFYRYGSCWF